MRFNPVAAQGSLLHRLGQQVRAPVFVRPLRVCEPSVGLLDLTYDWEEAVLPISFPAGPVAL